MSRYPFGGFVEKTKRRDRGAGLFELEDYRMPCTREGAEKHPGRAW